MEERGGGNRGEDSNKNELERQKESSPHRKIVDEDTENGRLREGDEDARSSCGSRSLGMPLACVCVCVCTLASKCMHST